MAMQESLYRDVILRVSIRFHIRYFLDFPSSLYVHEKSFFLKLFAQEFIFNTSFFGKFRKFRS